MQRVGIIDLGSNSARLVIVRINNNTSHHLIYTQKTSLRLGQKINDNKEITEDAIKETIEAVKKFSHMCKLFQTTKIFAVATAAIRSAKNGPEIIKRINAACDVNIKIISGENEAYYGYLGVINTIDEKDAILFDLGGGSLEIVLIKDRKPKHLLSIETGATNMTGKFNTQNQMSSKTFRELTTYVDQKLKKSLPWLKNSNLPIIGIGGTARTIAKIYQRRINYSYSKIHNFRMTSLEFDEVFNLLRTSTLEQRKKISGLNSDRADIILAGITIINTLMHNASSKELIISGCGLREGLFYDYFLSSLGKQPTIKNILKYSVKNLLSFTIGNNEHSKKVTDMASKMFNAWRDIHKLSDTELKILYISSTLHDIGISINYYAHHRHSAYLIENAPLMGLTHREQIMSALVASWHNGIALKNIKNKQLYRDFLNDKDFAAAKKLSIILAMAENLDFTETSIVQDIIPTVLPNGKAELAIKINDDLDIELGELKNNLNWFKKEFQTELIITKLKT